MTKQNTALQELIEWMDEQEYTPPYNDVRRKATELLEKEREQIEKAYTKGGDDEYERFDK